jgi:hypothetical protein
MPYAAFPVSNGMDKVLLIFGLALAFALVTTGGFGIIDYSWFGFSAPFGPGPKATGPDGGASIDLEREDAVGGASGSSAAPDTGRVEITSVNRSADAKNEYVTIANRNNHSISVSGWSIGNTQGKRYPVGTASQIPLVDQASPTTLKAGESAYIHTGASPLGYGFRENACMGYIAASYPFNPDVYSSCYSLPKPSPQQFNDQCLRYIERNSGTCRAPEVTANDLGLSDECQEYAKKHASYRSCVDAHLADSNFYQGYWHLYLSRTDGLWREFHDIITLYDQNGNVIDTYEY